MLLLLKHYKAHTLKVFYYALVGILEGILTLNLLSLDLFALKTRVLLINYLIFGILTIIFAIIFGALEIASY